MVPDTNRTLAEDIEMINEQASTSAANGTGFPSPSQILNYTMEEWERERKIETAMNYTIEEFDYMGNGTTPYTRFVHFLEQNEWLLWVCIVLGALMVLLIASCIVCWIYQHKKRIINQRSMHPDHGKRASAAGASLDRAASESNLESYKRPNMPPSLGSRPPTLARNSVLFPAPDMEPREFTNIETAADVFSINGIPTARAENFRLLPPGPYEVSSVHPNGQSPNGNFILHNNNTLVNY